MRFPLGNIVVSLNAATALAAFNVQLLEFLIRHGAGDSGLRPSSETEVDIRDGEYVWSVYPLGGFEMVVLEVSTTADRTSTTVSVSTVAGDRVL